MSKRKRHYIESTKPALDEIVGDVVEWMKDEVLPLWSIRGINPSLATTYKSLACRDDAPIANTQVGWLGVAQAQMVYILSQAQYLKWLSDDKSALVTQMIEFSGRHGVLPCRSDGFVHCLNPDLTISDERRLLLDHGCFMMASTASFVAYGVGNDLRRAYNIMHWLDIKMAHPEEGWCHEYGTTMPGSSKSYLHCLQAFLFLFEVTKKPCWIERASVVYDLFVERFFDPENSTVQKYMIGHSQEDELHNSTVSATEVFNWVWLLRRYQQLMGEMAGNIIEDIANQLYCKAKLVFDDKSSCKESSLLSSYILASSYQSRAGCPNAEVEFADSLKCLLDNIISDSHHGWCADSRSSDFFTVDSLFYLFEAIREAYLYINPEKREMPLREVGGL